MKKLIAANWKMYKTVAEADKTATELVKLVSDLPEDTEVAVFPPFTAIAPVVKAFKGKAGFSVGGQDIYPAVEGAFTGEISPRMLMDAGCEYVLCGHSERRHVIGESNELVGQKAVFALEQGLSVILCVGETLNQREACELADVLHEQLISGLKSISGSTVSADVVIAYEPVWAIGTGKVAGPVEIVEAHGLIRKYLKEFLPAQSQEIRILYGGSVKADNAAEIKALDNVNGLLVGGASLKAETFTEIIKA
jgi:triosephosphate isomerase